MTDCGPERAALVRTWEQWDTFSSLPFRVRVASVRTDRTACNLADAMRAYAACTGADALPLQRALEARRRAGLTISEALAQGMA